MSLDAEERAGRIAELFAAALERPVAERAAFLDEGCAGDGELRQELASLLEAHERPGAIDRLGEGVVAPLLSQLRGVLAPAVGAERRVGPYRVLERLARGGMGVVYRAWDTRLDRPVALKFLPQWGASDAARERFLAEARAVATLDHPHICAVHDIGETDDGELYIAMTCYDGETLAQKLERGPLDVAQAISLELQLLSGLAQAHARGVVHRDIKPANVMVTEEGVAKILDFGIAKLADVALTATGAHLGTAAYMSPEQVRGEAVDARTDLWSAGVVLYEMLAGERPFAEREREAVLHVITTAPPRPLSLVRPDVPPALERVVLRALAKRRDQRYGAALDMARELEEVLASVASGPAPAGGLLPPGGIRRRVGSSRLRRAILVTAPVLVLAAAGLVWKGTFHPAQPPSRPPTRRGGVGGSIAPEALHSIAVLPFVNLSPDTGNQYFSDGITDELINALSRVDGLRVAARTSSFAFKARSLPVEEIARQLHVADVLEGSVRRRGNQLRISVQLVRADSGYTLWSNTYDRELRDIFAVQQEIARAIVGALELRLASGAAPQRPPGSTTDLATYDLYLWGRYYFNARSESALRTAIVYFQRAIARDSSYAPAYAGLAASYNLLVAISDPPAPSMLRAKAAALKALELDSNLGEAHAALAYDLFMYDWDWSGAEQHFRRAIELSPSDATAHHWYSIYLSLTGRHEEALAEIDRALELDPVSLFLRMTLGVRLIMARRYADAAEHLRAVIDRDPQDGLARGWLGVAYIQQGRTEEAVAELRRAAELSSRQPWAQEALACAYAAAGRRAEALAILRAAPSRAGRHYVPPSWLARAYTALGDRAQAFRWLDRAYAEHDGWLPWIKVDPAFDRLRSDPGFDRLLERTGLSPSSPLAGGARPAG